MDLFWMHINKGKVPATEDTMMCGRYVLFITCTYFYCLTHSILCLKSHNPRLPAGLQDQQSVQLWGGGMNTVCLLAPFIHWLSCTGCWSKSGIAMGSSVWHSSWELIAPWPSFVIWKLIDGSFFCRCSCGRRNVPQQQKIKNPHNKNKKEASVRVWKGKQVQVVEQDHIPSLFSLSLLSE